MSGILLVLLLAACGAFFSAAEISLAASRKMRLKLLADAGDARARRLVSFQEQPGAFFTTVQIAVNAVAVMGGIAGDALLSPRLAAFLAEAMPYPAARSLAFFVSFLTVTALFVLFSDLIPKRMAMAMPEKTALKTAGGMSVIVSLCMPLSKGFNVLASAILRLFKMPEKRRNDITSDDIYAVMEAGAMAGVLRKQEKELIGNVFELETRTVTSVMTNRESIVYFDLNEDEREVRKKIMQYPHSTYLVCERDVEHVVGYVDSKELLERVLKGQSLDLKSGMQLRIPLVIPDTLTLAEAMDQFKGKGEDIAVVLNEYALVVGITSLKDIMGMLMGNLVGEEEQIMKRDEHSWLVEGMTPIDDVMRVFGIDEFPNAENYETVGGFLTYVLRRIPHRMDYVKYSGYKFEVMDIDNYKIDQVLVTRLEEKTPSEEKPGDEATGGNRLNEEDVLNEKS